MHQAFLQLFLFAAALLQLFLVVEEVAAQKYLRALFDSVFLVAGMVLEGVLLAVPDSAKRVGARGVVLWTAGVGLLAYAAAGYIGMRKRTGSSLSRESIKEGSDNLPDGMCLFDENGAVQLINRKMMSIGIVLFGKEIQTLDELRGALSCPPPTVECLDHGILLYRFSDGTVWRFTESVITGLDGGKITEVVAVDVTRLYEKQAELNRENARLADANKRMKWILDNMTDIVREEEILSMKMRVHDDIGHSILAAKKALVQQQDISVIRENAALWEAAVDTLYQANNMPVALDEWEAVQKRAQDLGVEIVLDGGLPGNMSIRHLLLLAIRECVTNCVRHAGGNRVFVKVECGEKQTMCEITNNGSTPKQDIVEGSGLSGLRRRIEREGGVMELSSTPRFALLLMIRQGTAGTGAGE